MKDSIKAFINWKVWLLIFTLIIILPVSINYLILRPNICPIVGEPKDWLIFWATYIPSIGTFIIIYINWKQHQATQKIALEDTKKRLTANYSLFKNIYYLAYASDNEMKQERAKLDALYFDVLLNRRHTEKNKMNYYRILEEGIELLKEAQNKMIILNGIFKIKDLSSKKATLFLSKDMFDNEEYQMLNSAQNEETFNSSLVMQKTSELGKWLKKHDTYLKKLENTSTKFYESEEAKIKSPISSKRSSSNETLLK